MPKTAKELSALEVKRLKWSDKTADKSKKKVYVAVGGVAGLYIQLGAPSIDHSSGSKSWIYRVTINDSRREIGLGGYPDVSLASARDFARELKKQILSGNDPLFDKHTQKAKMIADKNKLVTFNQLADEYISYKSQEYKSLKQTKNLSSWLERFVRPNIGTMVISNITVDHIVSMLKPIWNTKPETASKVRLHTEKIFQQAIIRDLGVTKNPASYKNNLDHLLATSVHSKMQSKNHPALPVSQASYFWSKLIEKNSVTSLALMFLILTASRPGAVRYLKWDEIDIENKIWTLKAHKEFGKVRKDHIVPLVDKAIQILRMIPKSSSGYVFTVDDKSPISSNTMKQLIKSFNKDEIKNGRRGFIDPNVDNRVITPHGFRSTFKDWARENTRYPDEVSELSLSHTGKDKTRAAYARSHLVDERRKMLNEWHIFLSTK